MNQVKEQSLENEVIYYLPKHLTEGDAAEMFDDSGLSKAEPQHVYQNVDALYHYFDPSADVMTAVEDEDRDLTQGEVIAKLIADRYNDAQDRKVGACYTRTEIGFQQFRDNTTFIGGDITRGHMNSIKSWMRTYFDTDTVFLNGEGFTDEHAVGTTLSPFEKLMLLAGRTKEVIDEGICKHWPTDSKAVMRFINANQTDTIYSTNRIYEENEQVDTKWVIEGRFLAEELIKIPGFQQNFNKLVIFGAMRYILSGEINLNKLYRLMAKLGRTNTRIFFVG